MFALTRRVKHKDDVDLRKRLSQLVDSPIPFYLDTNLQPCATLKRGVCSHPVMVCSMPKAGTYFIAEAVRRLGCEPTNLHLDHTVVWDYRQRTIEEIRQDSFRYMVEMPLKKSVLLVRPGQFALGHIEARAETKQLLKKFKKIFVFRELRDALISQMRFLKDNKSGGCAMDTWTNLPEGPEQMKGFFQDTANLDYMLFKYREMANWIDEPDVYSLSFEVLYGDQGKKARSTAIKTMCKFLNVPAPTEDIMASLIGQPTRTWSGKRSSREIYWNDDIEEIFRSTEGYAINTRLGYI